MAKYRMTEEHWKDIVATAGSDKWLGVQGAHDTARELVEYAKELRAELIETAEYAFYSGACERSPGKFEGWWDTMALSDLCRFGDTLVDAGVFERHPDGYGRRQFYRPVQEKPPE